MQLTMLAEVDDARALLLLNNGQRHMRYAVVNAINGTMLAAQKVERARVLGTLTVRLKAFIMRQIAVIKPRANVTAGRFYAVMSIGDKPGLLLADYESGGTHEPQGMNLAVPLLGEVTRPTFQTSIPKKYYLQALAFQRIRGTLRGLQETYIVSGVGVFQRQGTKTVLIYSFKPSVRIPARLGWEKTAETVAMETFPVLMQAQIHDAFQHELGDLFGSLIEGQLT